ncbi:methionine-tRNA ligase (MARS1) [Vairimorpha necatrix]|uniref:methionine--tRNA ligase n=1 Tax=Vairimorpha necatrix TaxID=6039 RepID=A0AAX4JFT7_9MICR
MKTSQKTKKIITSALPYVNNQPHLGNIIGCVLSGDIYSRFCKKNNENSLYICGTDEYGTAIEMAAFAQNKTPLEICEENRLIHKKIYDWFNIEFDHFGHTTSNEHTKNVQHFFDKIYKNGFFTEQEIEQFFCEKCKIFLADRYVFGTCKYCKFPDAKGDQCDGCGHTYKSLDLIDAKCTLCKSTPNIKETRHLFFDFSNFKDQLEDLYNRNSQYWSDNGKHITKSWLDQELLPRCMTRDLKNKWGVPVPLEGFEKKVFYVWFDAVIGYFTFLKECVEKRNLNEKIKNFSISEKKHQNYNTNSTYEDWLKDGEIIQFMGKDNVFFHTIVFPSLIFATKLDYPVIKKLSVTEFLLFENEKFSKSRGHGIFGLDLINNDLGSSCLWRYYLSKIRPEKCDSNFSFEHFANVIDADLNNNIGNFCNRVLKFIKNKNKKIIKIDNLNTKDEEFIQEIDKLYKKYLQNFKNIKIRDALEKILEISKLGNEYVQVAVNDKENRRHGFQVAFSVVVLLGQILEPFVPVSSEKLLKMCNVKKEVFREEFGIIKEGEIGDEIVPLFNKLDEAILEKLKNFKK